MPRFALQYDEYLWPSKDPQVTTDYGIDISDVAPADDVIISADWVPITEGSVTLPGGVTNAGLTSSRFIGGGTPGQVHVIEVTAHTSQGRHVNRTMRLPIEQLKG